MGIDLSYILFILMMIFVMAMLGVSVFVMGLLFILYKAISKLILK